MTFTLIRIAGEMTRPIRSIDAESSEDAWAIALSIYGDAELAIVCEEHMP